ncbi:uncharacterized protein LOC135931929 [Gordionus sp. m RMFG-2023]|uniref:uncharacterized protein LOC135931929 n=1 Tax=Gordionus sp. m RMFG-2023 TaxID=3053472 RepID=UPI0031FCADE2
MAKRMFDRYGRMRAKQVIIIFAHNNSLISPIYMSDQLKLPIQIDDNGPKSLPVIIFAALMNQKIPDISEIQAIVSGKDHIINLQYCNGQTIIVISPKDNLF